MRWDTSSQQLDPTMPKKIPASHTKIDDYLKVITKNDKSISLNPTNCVEVTMLILKLPNKKSSGYDNIDNILLKSIKDVSEKLASLFNLSMSAGVFPEMMKLAEVVPLYKSKERFLTSNYRPISLLITISKILEKIIYKEHTNFWTKITNSTTPIWILISTLVRKRNS